MKRSLICLAGTLCLFTTSVACTQVGKVEVIVTDYETGEALPNTEVVAGFNTSNAFEAGRSNHFKRITNSRGRCTLWGYGNGGSATIYVRGSSAFYGASETIEFFRHGSGPIARPWNPTIELRLKEKRNPIPMYAKNLNQKRFPEALLPRGHDPKKGWLEMPADSATVSYDLVQGDWVEPFGQGKIADLVFNIQREARVRYVDHSQVTEYERLASGATVEITVSNDGDGFVRYPVAEKDRHRGLRMPYEAPLGDYIPTVKRSMNCPPNERCKGEGEDDMNFFLRVRTVKNEDGKIISAHYGKIHGGFLISSFGNDITFAYYLNPTPNDRNVEFKRNSNLFTDLKGTEGFLEP